MGMRRRGPGIVGMAARTAVVAGTATAVSGRVARRQQRKYGEQDAAYVEQQAAAGDPRASAVRKALQRLSFQLSGAQLGITLTALLSGYLAEPAIAHLLAPVIANQGVATGIALAIATVFSMLFGELVPKNAALARPMPIVRATARPSEDSKSSRARPRCSSSSGWKASHSAAIEASSSAMRPPRARNSPRRGTTRAS